MSLQQTIRRTIESALRESVGKWGVVCRGLNLDFDVRINDSECFPAASLIKLPILAAAMAAAETDLDLGATVCIDTSGVSAEDMDGSGVLIHLTSPLVLTVRDLCVLMIIASDNFATNILIDRLGIMAINQTLDGLGIKDTRVNSLISNFDKLRSEGINPVTASEVARILEGIYRRELPNSDLMFQILRRQIYGTRIPLLLPYEDDRLIVAHKTGTLNTVAHDAGILSTTCGDYILCLLTQHQPSISETNMTMAQLSKRIYEVIVSSHASDLSEATQDC